MLRGEKERRGKRGKAVSVSSSLSVFLFSLLAFLSGKGGGGGRLVAKDDQLPFIFLFSPSSPLSLELNLSPPPPSSRIHSFCREEGRQREKGGKGERERRECLQKKNTSANKDVSCHSELFFSFLPFWRKKNCTLRPTTLLSFLFLSSSFSVFIAEKEGRGKKR